MYEAFYLAYIDIIVFRLEPLKLMVRTLFLPCMQWLFFTIIPASAQPDSKIISKYH